MKLPALIALVVLSLAANAALLLTPSGPRNAFADAVAVSDPRYRGTANESGTVSHDSLRPVSSPSTGDPATSATALPLHDLPALVSALRAKGYPPAVLRGLISALVQRELAPRYEGLRLAQGPPPYWHTGQSRGIRTDAETHAARQLLNQEHKERLDALLGPDAPAPDRALREVSDRLRFGALSSKKMAGVQAIEADYNELVNEIRSTAQGLLLPDDREKLALLESERRRDLLSILTPAEYEEMQFRGSRTGQVLRSQLGSLDPTEAEFRTIFSLQHAFDEVYGQDQRRPSSEWQHERTAAEQKLLADIKAALGPERGEEYERTRNDAYVQVFNIARQHQLPREKALQVWTLQVQMTEQLNTLNRDRSLDPIQRGAQLQALAREASPQLTALLGEAGMESYRKSAGRWLRTLEERAAALAAP